MPQWQNLDRRPRKVYDEREGFDIDVGWAYRIERESSDEPRRTVSVEVVKGGLADPGLPDDSRRAIQSLGQTAVTEVLDRDDPPRYLVVSKRGCSPKTRLSL